MATLFLELATFYLGLATLFLGLATFFLENHFFQNGYILVPHRCVHDFKQQKFVLWYVFAKDITELISPVGLIWCCHII